jgi:hypothetical protein
VRPQRGDPAAPDRTGVLISSNERHGIASHDFATGEQVLAEIVAQESASAEFPDSGGCRGAPTAGCGRSASAARPYLPLITKP